MKSRCRHCVLAILDTRSNREQGELEGSPRKDYMQLKGFIAVRKDMSDGHDWLDIRSFGFCYEDVQVLLGEVAEKIPQWDAANPTQRIVPCVVEV